MLLVIAFPAGAIEVEEPQQHRHPDQRFGSRQHEQPGHDGERALLVTERPAFCSDERRGREQGARPFPSAR